MKKMTGSNFRQPLMIQPVLISWTQNNKWARKAHELVRFWTPQGHFHCFFKSYCISCCLSVFRLHFKMLQIPELPFLSKNSVSQRKLPSGQWSVSKANSEGQWGYTVFMNATISYQEMEILLRFLFLFMPLPALSEYRIMALTIP